MTDASGPQKIVVGIDGSASSIDAFRWAVRQAQVTGSHVEAVMVWQYPARWFRGPQDFEAESRRALDGAIEEAFSGRTARPSNPSRRRGRARPDACPKVEGCGAPGRRQPRPRRIRRHAHRLGQPVLRYPRTLPRSSAPRARGLRCSRWMSILCLRGRIPRRLIAPRVLSAIALSRLAGIFRARSFGGGRAAPSRRAPVRPPDHPPRAKSTRTQRPRSSTTRLVSGLMQHRDRSAVRGQDARAKGRVALIARALHEFGEQSAAESDSLPVVRNSRGELNHTGLTRDLDVAHDSDSPAG